MILEWIRKNPQLALMLTELVNIGLRGVGTAAAVRLLSAELSSMRR